MLDDGVKAAGVDETQVKVADLSIHLLDAIEAGERALATPNAPLAVPVTLQSLSGLGGDAEPSVAAGDTATAVATIAAFTGNPDNLKLMVGIGPMIEGLLNEAGIHTFEQIAEASVQQLQDILPDLHDSRVEREDWIGQAQRFAAAKAAGEDLEAISGGGQVT
jgi:hypothetical protein